MKKSLILLILSATAILAVLSVLALFSAQASQAAGLQLETEPGVPRLPPEVALLTMLIPEVDSSNLSQGSPVSVQLTAGLAGSAAITGSVTSAQSGLPLDGAELILYKVETAGVVPITQTTTLSDGSYQLTGLDGGDYLVYARADGFAAGWYSQTVDCHLDASVVVVSPEQTTGSVDFELQAGGIISGYIYLEDGVTPAPGAYVGDFAADDSRSCLSVGIYSQADGAYQITSAQPGRRKVAAYAPGYAPEYYQEEILFSNADVVNVTTATPVTGVDFTLDRGGVISGTVYAVDGTTPYAGAYLSAVYVQPETKQWQRSVASTSSAVDGSYQLAQVPFGGTYAVLAFYAGEPYPGWQYYQGSPNISGATLLTVTQAYTPTNIDFQLGSSGTISGHVYTASGSLPLHHQVIVAATNIYTSPLSYAVISIPDGSYAIEKYLPADDYRVSATYPGYLSQYYNQVLDPAAAASVSVTIEDPAEDIDFQMQAYWPLQIGNRWVYRWSNSALDDTITETVQLVKVWGDRYTLQVSSPFVTGSAELRWQLDGLNWMDWDLSGQPGAPEWSSLLEYTFMPARFFYFKPIPSGAVWTPFDARWLQQGEYNGDYQAHSTIAAAPEAVTVAGENYQDALCIDTQISSANLHLAGEREMWFVPGKGLVKLVYQHADGQTTAAELVSLIESAVVLPASASSLVYSHTLGTATQIDIPAGAVSEALFLAYTPLETTTISPGYSFVGHAFDLQAYQNGLQLSGFDFNLPVTFTVHYRDQDVVALDERTLVLQRWDEPASSWQQAGCGLTRRQPAENWLSLPVCHLSQFALFGQGYGAYMPILFK